MVLCQVLEGVVKTKSAPPNYCKVLREIVEELCTAGLISDCEGCVLSQTPVLTTADVLLASLVTSSHTSQKKSNSIKRTSAGSMRSISISELPWQLLWVWLFQKTMQAMMFVFAV